jgi:hypothetical protein
MSTEAKVGAFVLSCAAVFAFTVIYLLNAEFGGSTVPYRTYLRYAGGLQPEPRSFMAESIPEKLQPCDPGRQIQPVSKFSWRLSKALH